MELVDIFNDKREAIGKIGVRDQLENGEYKVSIHAWIINKDGNILLHKRAKSKLYAHLWSPITGGSITGDTSKQTCIRECKEEIGIEINEKEMELIASYKRKSDYADLWVIKQNVIEFEINEEEVEDVMWVSLNKLKDMICKKLIVPPMEISCYFFIKYIECEYTKGLLW